MAEICELCHRPKATTDDHIYESRKVNEVVIGGFTGDGTKSHCVRAGFENFDVPGNWATLDCAAARDRWLTAEIARLQAVVEAVRDTLAARDGQCPCCCCLAVHDLCVEIAALLPPKEAEDA